jgi:hypothetical protein
MPSATILPHFPASVDGDSVMDGGLSATGSEGSTAGPTGTRPPPVEREGERGRERLRGRERKMRSRGAMPSATILALFALGRGARKGENEIRCTPGTPSAADRSECSGSECSGARERKRDWHWEEAGGVRPGARGWDRPSTPAEGYVASILASTWTECGCLETLIWRL